MKKFVSLLLCFAMLLPLAACGGNNVGDGGAETLKSNLASAVEMARAAADSQENAADFANQLTSGDGGFPAYVEIYGIDPAAVTDGAVLYAGGASACEIAVLVLEPGQAETAKSALEDYTQSRTGDFTGYAPEQAEIAENAAVRVRGDAAVLLMCGDPEAADQALDRFFFSADDPYSHVTYGWAKLMVSSQANAGEYDQYLVYGDEGFPEKLEEFGVHVEDVTDGAILWVGDGSEYRVVVLRAAEDPVLQEILFSVYEYFDSDPYRATSDEWKFVTGFNCENNGAAFASFHVFGQDWNQMPEMYGPSAREMARTVADSQPNAGDYTVAFNIGDEAFDQRVREYGLEPFQLQDGAILCTEDGEGEIAVLRPWSWGTDSRLLMSGPGAYMRDKGFQAPVRSSGTYIFGNDDVYLVTLFMCKDVDAAWNAFQSTKTAFLPEGQTAVAEPEVELDENGYVAFNPPNTHDMSIYDTSSILAAYESGDTSGLSEKDAKILAAAEIALGECVNESMSDYEKELAVHDWMVQNISYDEEFLDIRSNASPDALNPYGGLVLRACACLGYAASFQLLMDMLDIQCLTVVGASFNSGEDHAWNLVSLDNEWYAVDVTWDDPLMVGTDTSIPIDSHYAHLYFNVTSDFLRKTNHQWDYDSVPEATGTAYAYQTKEVTP